MVVNQANLIPSATRSSPHFAIGACEYSLKEIQRLAKIDNSASARQLIIQLADSALAACREVR